MKTAFLKPLHPLRNRVLSMTHQELPPLEVPMPLARILPRRKDPLDLRAQFRGLPPMPVRTIGQEGGAQ